MGNDGKNHQNSQLNIPGKTVLQSNLGVTLMAKKKAAKKKATKKKAAKRKAPAKKKAAKRKAPARRKKKQRSKRLNKATS